ncbi:MAG: T9SS type A sorting domain-containing protein [Bacteroidota bacterium]
MLKTIIKTVVIIAFTTLQGLAQLANWTPVVGTNFPANITGQINGMARMTQLKFHPTNANKYYAITSEGGLFTSTNQGLNWMVATGTETFAGSCSSICIDYTNDQNLFLGTGDPNYYSNGQGIFKSSNGGMSFTATSLTNCLVIDIIQNPVVSTEFVAVTNKGIYKSINGGTTWLAKTATTIPFCDIKQNAALNSQILYACTNENATRFYRSTDFGNTWTQITTGIITPTTYIDAGARIGVSPANPNVVYLEAIGGGGVIYISNNGGLTFAIKKNEGTGSFLNFYDDLSTDSGQGNYNNTITVDRNDASKLWLQAHNTWLSIDSGATWTMQTHWYEKVHTDMHQIQQSPYDANQLYSCNDGGVWLSMNGGDNWVAKSDGIFALEIGDNCGMSSPVLRDFVSIGTQDNGRLFGNSNGWVTNVGGDDYAKRKIDYNGNIYYDGDERQVNHTGPVGTYGLPTTNWNAFSFNRTNTNLGFMGLTNVYRSTNISNGTTAWTQISTFNQTIVDVHSCIADPNRLYVLISNGDLYVTSNALAASPSFSLRTLPGNASNLGSVVAMANNANTVYVCENNKVYYSVNAGVSWVDVTYNLPNVNHRRILAEEFGGSEELVFIATNNAVYYKKVGQTTWTNYSTNLPSRRSPTEFSMYDDGTSQSKIRYACFGRAMWESSFGNLRILNANLTANETNPCQGNSVQFFDISAGNPTSWNWAFAGGTPATSTLQNPVVTYNTSGIYSATLSASDGTLTSVGTKTAYINVKQPNNLPLAEGFLSTAYPPANWELVDDATDNITWERVTTAGAQNSPTCIKFDNYNNNVTGTKDEIRTPVYNLISAINPMLSFDIAYQTYDNVYSDTLLVLVSSDCGITFNPIYTKGGSTLATVPGNNGGYFEPSSATQWRNELLNLSAYAGLNNVQIAFQNRSHYGQSIFLDNINLSSSLNVSVNEILAENGVTVFPNPNEGTFTLSINSVGITTYKLAIINAVGQEVLSDSMSTTNGVSNKTISLKNYSKGIYWLKLTDGKTELTKKIVTY